MSKRKILIPIIVFTSLIVILIFLINQSHQYNKLYVSQSKWNSIKESRTENKNLTLDDIKFNDYKLIIDEKSDTLYYSIINNSKNKYNPNVSYSINNKSGKLVVLAEEITEERIKSNYQFKIMIYDDKQYHIYNLKCTDLPILNIAYNKEEEIDQKNIQMEMYAFDNLSNIPNKITISSGKIRKNEDDYIFSLHMLTPGKNKRRNKLSILNMKPNSEYILTKLNDISGNSQEDSANMKNRKNRVELFFNNVYKGVYFLDYIEENVQNNNNILDKI